MESWMNKSICCQGSPIFRGLCSVTIRVLPLYILSFRWNLCWREISIHGTLVGFWECPMKPPLYVTLFLPFAFSFFCHLSFAVPDYLAKKYFLMFFFSYLVGSVTWAKWNWLCSRSCAFFWGCRAKCMRRLIELVQCSLFCIVWHPILEVCPLILKSSRV